MALQNEAAQVMGPLKWWCLLLLLACSKPDSKITGIDWKAWKADRNGCAHKRLAFLQPLSEQVGELKALSEMDIVNMMGRPDQNELYERNQKFYTYFIEPGPGCPQAGATPSRLVIRFNAVGLAKEADLEK